MRSFAIFLVVLSLTRLGHGQSGRPEGTPGGAARPQVVIVSAETDFAIGRLFVRGTSFGTTEPLIALNQVRLSVLSHTSVSIDALLPPGIPPGSYLLTVSYGAGVSDNDSFHVTIGAAGPAGPKGDPGDPGEPGPRGEPGFVTLPFSSSPVPSSWPTSLAIGNTAYTGVAVRGDATAEYGAGLYGRGWWGVVGRTTSASGIAIKGDASAEGDGGVVGSIGVFGVAAGHGYGLVGRGGRAPLRLEPAPMAGPPESSGHQAGELYVDSAGSLYYFNGARWTEAARPPADPNPVGTVLAFAGVSAPAGYLMCDGRAVSRAEYAGLFSVIGELYGAGDSATTFNLPDLRGRGILGAGAGEGLTPRGLGQQVGQERHSLTIDQMPRHSHATRPFGGGGPCCGVQLMIVRDVGGSISDVPTSEAGGSQPFSLVQPSSVLNYVIRF